MEDALREFLKRLGEDPARSGFQKTPERWRKAMEELTSGYAIVPEDIVKDAVFPAEKSEMVIMKDIAFHSLCEHHLLPFSGVMHVAYVPEESIIGFSKIPRIVEIFTRRLQVQERLGEEIAEAIDRTIHPKGVGVVIEATHFCMTMRGVRKEGIKAITTHLTGIFRMDLGTREEFLQLVRHS